MFPKEVTCIYLQTDQYPVVTEFTHSPRECQAITMPSSMGPRTDIPGNEGARRKSSSSLFTNVAKPAWPITQRVARRYGRFSHPVRTACIARRPPSFFQHLQTVKLQPSRQAKHSKRAKTAIPSVARVHCTVEGWARSSASQSTQRNFLSPDVIPGCALRCRWTKIMAYGDFSTRVARPCLR